MRRTLLLLLLIGCSDPPDKTAACPFQSAATIQDRKVIGAVAPYAADYGLDEEALRVSIAARRQAAWKVVEKVVAPVPLADLPNETIAAWHTWFTREDFDRVFKKTYRDLGPAGRAARAPIDVDAGFAWNNTALDELSDWPEQRYNDYLAAVDTPEKANGIGGISRVGYSSGAMKHLLASYNKQYECRVAAAPDPFVAQDVKPGVATTAVEQVAVDSCAWKVLGPFMAGAGTVKVTARGDGDADLYVRKGSAPTPDEHDCKSAGGTSEETCSVDGDGAVFVAVFGAKTSTLDVSIEYVSADVAQPTCLDGEMPRDAVLIKADWHRKLPGENLPVFDTSASRLREHLAGFADWAEGDGSTNPSSDEIYTLQLPNGNEFRLPALHIMTKELDHWLWITLWYSPTPDTDFGADRPTTLPGPWKNYKMCVASSYLEGDADPRGGQAGSLGDALAAVNRGVGSPTWCSNPYLERGAGNAATNCIGCHQHGGTMLTPEDILATEPHHGSTRVRNNFFTDYLWAIKGGQGEDLSSLVQAEVDYWDANDP